MKFWTVAYRVAVVGLLSAIALQLGGWDYLAMHGNNAKRAIRNFGKEPEGPAPAKPGQMGGIDAMFQEGTDRALRDMAERQQRPASASR